MLRSVRFKRGVDGKFIMYILQTEARANYFYMAM